MRKIEEPRPHAIVRNHATRLRVRIGFGNGLPQRFYLNLVQIRMQLGSIIHAGILGGVPTNWIPKGAAM